MAGEGTSFFDCVFRIAILSLVMVVSRLLAIINRGSGYLLNW